MGDYRNSLGASSRLMASYKDVNLNSTAILSYRADFYFAVQTCLKANRTNALYSARKHQYHDRYLYMFGKGKRWKGLNSFQFRAIYREENGFLHFGTFEILFAFQVPPALISMLLVL